MTAYFSHYSLADVAYQPHVEYLPGGIHKPADMSNKAWWFVRGFLREHKPTALGWKCLLNEAQRRVK